MTLEEQIAYWKKQIDKAKTKEAALVAFGVYAGLSIAKEIAKQAATHNR